jgi:hypothetical protein
MANAAPEGRPRGGNGGMTIRKPRLGQRLARHLLEPGSQRDYGDRDTGFRLRNSSGSFAIRCTSCALVAYGRLRVV